MTTNQLSALLGSDPVTVLESDRCYYLKQILQAAEIIASNAEKRPVVLLAGPSGAGKTTTALLIGHELNRRGMQTYTLSMDDYFTPLTIQEQERMRRNEMDLETPARVDIPFFKQQLDQILAGERVLLPRYNFMKSTREFDGRTLERKCNEIVIMEGIHALNPEVTGNAAHTTRVYVSVRTRITSRDGTVLHPSKIRLVRRLMRDHIYRGRTFAETIGMLESVDRGEQMYIMPYKVRAHCSVDSFYSAEMGVYRALIFEQLQNMAHPLLTDAVKVMQELPLIPDTLVPPDSLLREFIGD